MKRLLDIVAAGLGLLVLSPLLLFIAWRIRATMGSPVLFKQQRPGLHGKPFTMLKFRTMRDALDHDGNPLPDAKRITKLGRFLRSSSLDELPELWNVLKGDMSLVGPRPLLMEYLPYYTDDDMRRHDVRPGITGLAQISGRNNLTWEEKFELDLNYVRTNSFLLDLKILLYTLVKVFKRADVLDAAPQGSFDSYRQHNDFRNNNERS